MSLGETKSELGEIWCEFLSLHGDPKIMVTRSHTRCIWNVVLELSQNLFAVTLAEVESSLVAGFYPGTHEMAAIPERHTLISGLQKGLRAGSCPRRAERDLQSTVCKLGTSAYLIAHAPRKVVSMQTFIGEVDWPNKRKKLNWGGLGSAVLQYI